MPEFPEPRPQPPTQSQAYTDFMEVKAAYDAWQEDRQRGGTRHGNELHKVFNQLRTQYDNKYAEQYHGNYSWDPRHPPPKEVRPDDEAVAAYDREVALWNQRRADWWADQLGNAAGRQYRRETYTDENGRTRHRILVSDDGGETWTVDEGQSQAFDRAYENLDKAGDIADRLADFTFEKYRANADPRFTNYETPEELKAGLLELYGEFQNGNVNAEALEEGARMLGFEGAGEMQEYLRQLREETGPRIDPDLDPDSEEYREQRSRLIGGQTGLTAQERADRTALFNNQMDALAAQTDRVIDNIYGESGSAMRAFQVADQYRREVRDATLRHQLALGQEDWMRKEAEYNAKWERYKGMVAMGTAAQGQAAGIILQERSQQLQAFSLRVSTAMASEAQLLARAGMDMAALESAAALYQGLADREIGLTQAVETGMDRAWERHVRPHLLRYNTAMDRAKLAMEQQQISTNAYIQRQNREAQERIARMQAEASQKEWWEYLLEGIFTIGGAVAGALVTGGFGAGAGAAAGGAVGGAITGG